MLVGFFLCLINGLVLNMKFRKRGSIDNKPMTVKKIAEFIFDKMKRIDGFSPLENTINILVAGFDNNEKVGRLYEVNMKSCQPRDYAGIGSGSAFVHDNMSKIKYNSALEKGQVGELVRRSLCTAGLKDRATGGDKIKVYFIRWNGVEELSKDKFETLRDLYCPGKKSAEELANQGDTDVEMVDVVYE
ncbi:hypothetical protein MKW92_029499 [Papaver armeniacum]|nr:hypothetical protein MKW92_029499 [Papaver armeniacum]